jgi:hypothetical protein
MRGITMSGQVQAAKRFIRGENFVDDAMEQPSTHLVTGPEQDPPLTQNSEITVSTMSIDRRLAKLKRKLGGAP